MRIFKTKAFARFARGALMTDKVLRAAVARAERGLVDADLGSGVIKQRIARRGAGKCGGFRTIIPFRHPVPGGNTGLFRPRLRQERTGQHPR